MLNKRLFLLICMLVLIFGTTGSLEQNNSSFSSLGNNAGQSTEDLLPTSIALSGNVTNFTQNQDPFTSGVDISNQTPLQGGDQGILVPGCTNQTLESQESIQDIQNQTPPGLSGQLDSSRNQKSDSAALQQQQKGSITQKGGKEKPSHADDELIVRFKSEPGKKTDNEIAGKAHKDASQKAKKNSNVKEDFSVKKDFNEKGLSGTQVVKIPEGMTVDEAIALYAENSDVLSVEPNYRIELMEIPDDPNFSLQWGLLNTAYPDADINVVPAWNISTGSHGVIIAIPDTGIDTKHPDLAANIWSNPREIPGNGIDDDGNGYIDDTSGWDFVNNDANPSDDNGHGTHVAGIAGAVGNNGIGISGVMWESDILPLKVIGTEGYGYESDAIEAVLYAQAAGAQVISISWGSNGESQALAEALANYPGLVVCAAGNSAQDNDINPLYPASYPLDNIISVTATDAQNNLASFADYGVESVDIAAPGISIYSILPGSSYGSKSGTSMAAPFVAGIAGLVVSEQEDIRGAELAGILKESSDPLISLDGRVSSAGRVNAENALIVAKEGNITTPTPTPTPAVTLTPTPTPIIPEGEPQIAPLNPEFVKYMESLQSTLSEEESDNGFTHGYIPSPVDRSSMQGQILQISENKILSLPTSYDLRSYGRVTSVKDQGSCGSCWAFATYGSTESVLMPGETQDFSENNLKNLHGFDLGSCSGGNYDMSTAYLTRWSGPVSEAADPYNPSSSSSPAGLSPVKHVQDVLYIPNREGPLDNDNIKSAVIEYGGVSTAFFWNSGYYNSNTKTYYYSGSTSPNHAVTIVGWDDNKEVSGASGNGAFLVKNSWGTYWGDQGYFWISYYDSKMARDFTNVVFLTELIDNYDNIYQYDPLGWVLSYGYGTNTAWAANVFTSVQSEQLNAVGFYAAMPDTEYEIYIYKNPTDGPTSTEGAVSYQTGTVEIPGYRTISLDTPVSLSQGETFSIVVKLTTPGYTHPIAIECPYINYASAATASAGQSYVSYTGTSWTDLTSQYSNTNVCVKGYTSNVQPLDAEIVSHTIPSTMVAGKSYPVTVTMKNTGIMTWNETNHIRLGGVADEAGHAYLFGGIRYNIPPGTSVATGEQYDFTFTMTAPTTPGTYFPSYCMVWDGHEWFGPIARTTILVTAPTVDAQVISTSIPSTMVAGQSYQVTVMMKNTGTMTWNETNHVRLGGVADEAGHAYLFGGIRYNIPPGTSVATGEQYDFTFTMTAPTTPGTYFPSYCMVWDGHEWFGTITRTTILVTAPTVDAQVISTSIPSTMVAGQSYQVTVTMKNTGTMTWSEGSMIRLGGVGDTNGHAFKFGGIRYFLPAETTVATGEQYDFIFTMTAPTTPGTYFPSYCMVWDGHEWFGTIARTTILVSTP